VSDWKEGGLYSTPQEDGSFSVLKILKTDDGGVHVRIYSNRFDEHPGDVDAGTLYMAGLNKKPDEAMGMGHLPVSYATFEAWRPEYIKTVAVGDDELEGYDMWFDAKGGYF
jgi:hypothetical protein